MNLRDVYDGTVERAIGGFEGLADGLDPNAVEVEDVIAYPTLETPEIVAVLERHGPAFRKEVRRLLTEGRGIAAVIQDEDPVVQNVYLAAEVGGEMVLTNWSTWLPPRKADEAEPEDGRFRLFDQITEGIAGERRRRSRDDP